MLRARRALTVMAATTLAVVILPAAAVAHKHGHRPVVIPPDNSGASQYVEVIPTASGGQPTQGIHTGHSGGGVGGDGSGPSAPSGGQAGSNPTVLAPSTQRALVRQGQDGSEAAAIAEATAPRGVHGANLGAPGAAPALSPAPPAPAGAPATEVVKALTGATTQGGLGPILPMILIATVFAAAGTALERRRRRAT